MSDYYFAYGSNMNPDRMAARGLSVLRALAGRLDDVSLAFNKRAADAPHRSYANVVYAPGDQVEGVLYQLACPHEISKMDPFEGTPRLYSRELFSIGTAEGVLQAWVYVANRAMITEGILPERWYLDHLLAGRRFLSETYWNRLQQTPCQEGGEPRC